MRYTLLAPNAFEKIQMNAGILASDFTPSTGALTESNILGVTSGGISFTATPEYADFGEDIDNCPKNTMELKRIQDVEVKISGTFAAIDTALAKLLMSAADIGTTDTTKVTPRKELLADDFADMWLIGDYSDKTGATNGGYVAIKMLNALSTGGFSVQTTDKEKGKFAFEFTGHYSYDEPDTVPYEVYIKAGTAEPSN
jgi:hypothetical protein